MTTICKKKCYKNLQKEVLQKEVLHDPFKKCYDEHFKKWYDDKSEEAASSFRLYPFPSYMVVNFIFIMR